MKFFKPLTFYWGGAQQLKKRCIHQQLNIYNAYKNKSAMFDEKIDYEIEFHADAAEEWWSRKNPLHALNHVRVPFIRNGIRACGFKTTSNIRADSPRLDDITILDVGCGGGILSEALARVGANVTGIDINKRMITVASAHYKFDPSIIDNLKYIHTSIYEHEKENIEKYNAVVVSEVIEHVSNKEKFLKSCVNALKPGGSIFITSPNKTLFSKIFAVQLAEALNIVPKGTHDFRKFTTPEEVTEMLKKLGCLTRSVEGIIYNPLNGRFSMVSFKHLMYAIHAQKRVPIRQKLAN